MSFRALRVVWGRLRTDWPFLFACWLLVATATTLVTAGALYADTVELGSVRRALAEADPANQGVLVRLAGKAAELGSLDAAVRPVLARSFEQAGATVVQTALSSSLLPAEGGQPGVDTGTPIQQQLVVLGAYDQIDQHATLVGGRWPASGQKPMEGALSAKATAALGLQLGSRLQLADAATPGADPAAVTADVVVVGIWQPDKLTDPYWLGDQLDLEGITATTGTTRGPVIVTKEDLAASATAAGLDLRWRALPNIDGIELSRIDALRAGLSQIPAALAAALPAGRNVSVNTKLADVLGTIDRSVAVSRSGVVLVILQFVLLAGYAVLLAGALLVERRRAEVALLRARGARPAQVGLLAVAESMAIAIPAALIAPFLALGIIAAIGNVGAVGEAGIIAAPALTVSVLAVTVIAGLACVLVVSLPALVSDLDLAHVRAAIGRPLGRTLAQRVGLDVVLVVLTAIGLYQLQSYGLPLARGANGQLTIDPILIAAPALSLAAGALLVIRIVPRTGEIADRLLHRLRGLTVPLASSEIARRPLRYTRTALLVVLAAALATFAATYTSTWADSQAAQAAYQSGADVRLTINPQSAAGQPAGAASITSQAGVSFASPVIRDLVDTGRTLRNINALMLDASDVAGRVSLSAETATRNGGSALAAIGATTADFHGIALPPATRRAAVVMDVALAPTEPGLFGSGALQAADGEGVEIDAQFLTADGQVVQVIALAQTFNATATRLALLMPTSTGATTPELLDLRVRGISPLAMTGTITLDRIEASPSDSGDADWALVANPADVAGWGFTGGGATLTFDQLDPLLPTDEFANRREQVFRWGSASTNLDLLRVIASDSFLAASGSSVGDPISVTYHTATLAAQIAAAVPNFPSLDPQRPFLVIDRPSLRVALHDAGVADPSTNEWWLWVQPGQADAVAEALAAPPVSGTGIVSETRLRQSLERDPVALCLIGALLLGSLAAAMCAAVGLVVGAIVSTRERATETALLRALGMSRGGVTASVIIDNAYLLAFGLPAGIGLGLLIGLLVLPHTPLNRTGVAVVPAPQVVVPVEALAGLVVVGVVMLLVTVAAAARAANRAPIADILRQTAP